MKNAQDQIRGKRQGYDLAGYEMQEGAHEPF